MYRECDAAGQTKFPKCRGVSGRVYVHTHTQKCRKGCGAVYDVVTLENSRENSSSPREGVDKYPAFLNETLRGVALCMRAIYIHVYIHTYVHTYIHTYIYYIHTHMYIAALEGRGAETGREGGQAAGTLLPAGVPERHSDTPAATGKEARVRSEVIQKYFNPLPLKHWEGVELAKYKKAMEQLKVIYIVLSVAICKHFNSCIKLYIYIMYNYTFFHVLS